MSESKSFCYTQGRDESHSNMEMSNESITLESWPNAILHFDGDAFFASCEQSIHPELKGRPVVTGKERNIVASMSYEAKARGVKRATPMWQVKKICPDAIILPSDYETYSLISKRMFSIVRRFTPMVEESSIDEGFADIKGLRRLYRMSYEAIGLRVQETVEKELDLPISVGLGPTKTVAKLASRYKKPRGFTAVPAYELHIFLKDISVGDVCGIGENTEALLKKYSIQTAFDYVKRSADFIQRLLGKVGIDLWRELRGGAVYLLNCDEKSDYDSISKTKTFTPPSADYDYVRAQLLRNTESALIKLRRYHLRAKRLVVYLRGQDFRSASIEADLSRASASPLEVFPLIKEMFAKLFQPHTLYRATGVVLSRLEAKNTVQFDLFEDPLRAMSMERLSEQMDEINARYGKHTVSAATGLFLGRNGGKNRVGQNERNLFPKRKLALLKGETFRQRLNIPVWQIEV